MTQVLVREDVHRIPEANLCTRWTKSATAKPDLHSSGIHSAVHTSEAKRRMLVMKALEVANSTELSDKNATQNKRASTTTQPNGTVNTMTLRCLGCPAKRGRRVGTNLRSWKFSAKKRRKDGVVNNDQPHTCTTEDEENPISGRTRPVQELIEA